MASLRFVEGGFFFCATGSDIALGRKSSINHKGHWFFCSER